MQLIRNNLNMLCVFKQNEYYTKMIYDSFVGSDMRFDKFKQICNGCWKEDYGFLTINLLLKPNEGKYMNRFLDINDVWYLMNLNIITFMLRSCYVYVMF